jgi:biotin transport system substrate-specific component
MNSVAAVRVENHTGLKNVLLVMGATLLIALSGQVSFPLPFTPVPLALQGSMCLLMAALLGRRLGMISVGLFLFMGAIGFPVFSLGGAGLPILLGPRGGYLIGYLLGTWVTATIIERQRLSSPRLKTLAMGAGNLVIYACGLPQLALFVGAERVILLGMLPFLAGDLLKLFIGYRVLKSL